MIRLYRSVASRASGLHGAALLILRAVVGWMFILHALFQFQDGTVPFQASILKPLGLPAPGLLGWLIPGMEMSAGILLIAGLLTRLIAGLLGGMMLFTGMWAKLSVWHTGVLGPNGSGGAEVDILYLTVFLLLIAAGPGLLAADSLVGLEDMSHDPVLARMKFRPAEQRVTRADQPAPGGRGLAPSHFAHHQPHNTTHD